MWPGRLLLIQAPWEENRAPLLQGSTVPFQTHCRERSHGCLSKNTRFTSTKLRKPTMPDTEFLLHCPLNTQQDVLLAADTMQCPVHPPCPGPQASPRTNAEQPGCRFPFPDSIQDPEHSTHWVSTFLRILFLQIMGPLLLVGRS